MNTESLNKESSAPSSETAFEMRCPNCRKLFSVEPKLLSADVHDVSKFQCVACQTPFLALKPELHGYHFLETRLLETQFAPLAETSLPAAESKTSTVAPGELEVARVLTPSFSDEPLRASLAAVPLRPHPREDLELAEKAELIALWDSVLAKYEDVSRHTTFLKRCFEEQRLAFATHKYAQILVLDPGDQIARRMRGQAMGLASYGFDATANGMSKLTWKVPLPSFNNLIIFLGTIAVFVGLGLPHARQAAGLGFAMIALSLGLRFFLRRPSS